uniref:Protein SLY1 n=1 Tax=Lygus hesperus TaxID=30085 RepID=A0A0A9ZFH2_LYGHE
MRLNKCTIDTSDTTNSNTGSGSDTGPKNESTSPLSLLCGAPAITHEIIEIDPDRDAFYSENASLDFSAIGPNIEAALKSYKTEYTALSAQNANGLDVSAAAGGLPVVVD